jgi:hypothetical protein
MTTYLEKGKGGGRRTTERRGGEVGKVNYNFI